MAVRAKLKLVTMTVHEFSTTMRFDARYDADIPEDQSFSASTPSGHFEMVVTNPKAIEQFSVGKDYYVDFTPVVPAA